MKNYLFLFLASLVILQGCNWFEGNRGDEGRRGRAGVNGVDGVAGIFEPTICNPALPAKATPSEVIDFYLNNTPACFPEYVNGLNHQKWQGKIIAVYDYQIQVNIDGVPVFVVNLGTRKFKIGAVFDEDLKILRATRHYIEAKLPSTSQPILEFGEIN